MAAKIKIKNKKNSKIHIKILRSILIAIGLYISINAYMTILLLGLLAYSIGDLIYASRKLIPVKPLGLATRFKILFTLNMAVTFMPTTIIMTRFADIEPPLTILTTIGRIAASFIMSLIIVHYFKQDAAKIQNFITTESTKWIENRFSV